MGFRRNIKYEEAACDESRPRFTTSSSTETFLLGSNLKFETSSLFEQEWTQYRSMLAYILIAFPILSTHYIIFLILHKSCEESDTIYLVKVIELLIFPLFFALNPIVFYKMNEEFRLKMKKPILSLRMLIEYDESDEHY